MRIKMLTSKTVSLPGGGRLTFEAGSYYLTGGTDLSEEQAIDWILEGAAEDEAGEIVRPEPEPERDAPADEPAPDVQAFTEGSEY